MTCYSILVCLPTTRLNKYMIMMNEKRLFELVHLKLPNSVEKVVDNNLYYWIDLCDQDAALFLKEIPAPFYVKEVRYQYDKERIIYTNRFVSTYGVNVKPFSKIEKDVVWAAKATERWTPKA